MGEATFLTSAYGREGWPAADRPEIAFVGRSNVGKSSCLNVLVGQNRLARVSKTPGRTQAINFFDVRRGGKSLRFADLPGYGYAKVPGRVQQTWDAMIGEYLSNRETLALVVILADLRHDASELDVRMVRWLDQVQVPGILVCTKADRIGRNQRLSKQVALCRGLGVPRDASLLFSAPDRLGEGPLWDRIVEAGFGGPERG